VGGRLLELKLLGGLAHIGFEFGDVGVQLGLRREFESFGVGGFVGEIGVLGFEDGGEIAKLEAKKVPSVVMLAATLTADTLKKNAPANATVWFNPPLPKEMIACLLTDKDSSIDWSCLRSAVDRNYRAGHVARRRRRQ
jgi:hypothetical protein